MSDEQERLARLETVIPTMASDIAEIKKLIARMVRVEERQTNHDAAMQRMGRRIDSMERAIADLAVQISTHNKAISIAERFLWIVVTAGVGWAAYMFKPVV